MTNDDYAYCETCGEKFLVLRRCRVCEAQQYDYKLIHLLERLYPIEDMRCTIEEKQLRIILNELKIELDAWRDHAKKSAAYCGWEEY